MAENNFKDMLDGGGFASLLQNPDIAAKLPRIMEALAPVMAEMRTENTEQSAPPVQEETPASAPAASVPASAGPSPEAMIGKLLSGAAKPREGSIKRIALLKALEPYLSDNRREAMEYICKVSSLLDILSEVM